MCGIAGIIHRGNPGGIGKEMTSMLQSLKHRGPDSTGFAMYGVPSENEMVMRFKVAEQEDLNSGFEIHQQIKDRKALVDSRLKEMGATILNQQIVTEYAYRYTLNHSGDMRKLADMSKISKAQKSYPLEQPWNLSKILAMPPWFLDNTI